MEMLSQSGNLDNGSKFALSGAVYCQSIITNQQKSNYAQTSVHLKQQKSLTKVDDETELLDPYEKQEPSFKHS